MNTKKAVAQMGARLLGEATGDEFLIRINGPAITVPDVYVMALSQTGVGPALTGELHIDKTVLIIQEQRPGVWLIYSEGPEPIGAIETNNFLEYTILNSAVSIPHDMRIDSFDENNPSGAVALAATLLYLIRTDLARLP